MNWKMDVSLIVFLVEKNDTVVTYFEIDRFTSLSNDDIMLHF